MPLARFQLNVRRTYENHSSPVRKSGRVLYKKGAKTLSSRSSGKRNLRSRRLQRLVLIRTGWFFCVLERKPAMWTHPPMSTGDSPGRCTGPRLLWQMILFLRYATGGWPLGTKNPWMPGIRVNLKITALKNGRQEILNVHCSRMADAWPGTIKV